MNKTGILIGVVVAIIVLAGGGYFVITMPTKQEETSNQLEGAFVPGDKEFEAYTKEIIITNDPKRLMESRTALGDVIMRIGGRVRNKGNKTLTLLQISVGMVDTKNKLIKEKEYLIVPDKFGELRPGDSIDVNASVNGFSDDDDRANARWKVTAMKFKDE